jgi:hypothetical protein
MHELLEVFGDDAMRAAFARGLADRVFGAEHVGYFLLNPNGAADVAQQELLP